MAKSRNIIAIGGGGFGANPGQGIIEDYILKQTKKKNPKICFIPTATGDNEAYKVNFYSTFTNLNCQPSHLDFFKRTPDLNRLIFDQDVVFVGGGNTKSMLAVWKEWGLDRILLRAYSEGIIMSGVSAGAICWFEKGITDSWKEHQAILPCLGFVKGICCPHYDEEPERIPFVNEILNQNKIKRCIAIEGYCALHLIDDVPRFSVSFGDGNNCYLVSKKNSIIETNQIENTGLIQI